MKKLVFGLIATVLFGIVGNAQTSSVYFQNNDLLASNEASFINLNDYYHSNEKEANVDGVEVTVGATIDIGRNSTGNCSRFGLCTSRIKVTVKIKEVVCSRSNRTVNEFLKRDLLKDNQFNSFVFNNSGALRVYIDINNLKAIKQYMNSDVFIVEEDYIFNDEITGIKEYLVKTGEYEYNYDEEKDLYFVNF